MQPSQPASPNPQYDFIMNSGQQPKKGWLPNLGLPRPVQYGLAAVLVLIVLIISWALLFGGKSGSTQEIISLMARAQEISRVSTLAGQQTQDSNTKALAATVNSALGSQETQLKNYLSIAGQKIDSKLLAADQNSAIDTQLQSAVQNNNLESTYINYLSDNLTAYKSSITSEFTKTSSSQLKAILSDAYDSVQTILSSPSFK
jgi:hypothetical protein